MFSPGFLSSQHPTVGSRPLFALVSDSSLCFMCSHFALINRTAVHGSQARPDLCLLDQRGAFSGASAQLTTSGRASSRKEKVEFKKPDGANSLAACMLGGCWQTGDGGGRPQQDAVHSSSRPVHHHHHHHPDLHRQARTFHRCQQLKLYFVRNIKKNYKITFCLQKKNAFSFVVDLFPTD